MRIVDEVPLLSGCSLNQVLASAWLAWQYRLYTSKDTTRAQLEAEARMAQWLLAVQRSSTAIV